MNELNLCNPNFFERFEVPYLNLSSGYIYMGIRDKENWLWRGQPIKMARWGNLGDNQQVWAIPFATDLYYAKDIHDLVHISRKFRPHLK